MMQNCARKFVRVSWDSDIQLITREGTNLKAQIKNVSLGGLEMICDRAAAITIMPKGYYFDPEHPTVLSVIMSITEADNVLDEICHVKNMRRLAENIFAFNLSFFNLKPKSQRVLEHFVASRSMSI